MFGFGKKRKITSDTRYMEIGPPRAAFTLMCSVLNTLVPLKSPRVSPKQQVLNALNPLLGKYLDIITEKHFFSHYPEREVIHSGEFKLLTGGPKWIDKEDHSLACIRKYFGVKGKGDFTFLVWHPKQILDYDLVIHSHMNPSHWLKDPYYKDYLKFTTVRSPIGTVNSSVFSINALASEYVVRFVPGDQEPIRQKLATYKMTDLKFFEGLIMFLENYYKEFLPVHQQFDHLMRWEDLLTHPIQEIQKVAKVCDIQVSDQWIEENWSKLDHRNLTRWHQHTFRKGKGIVGDWKNWLTNHHLELMRAHGFDEILETFGYEKIKPLDESKYNEWQTRINDCINQGKVIQEMEDDDLFWFAFNKTNLVANPVFNFKTYPKKIFTKIERSTFKDEAVISAFSEALDEGVQQVNHVLKDALSRSIEEPSQVAPTIEAIKKEYPDIFAHISEAEAIR